MQNSLTFFERFRVAIAIVGFFASFTALWMISLVATWTAAFVYLAIAVLAMIVSYLAIGRSGFKKGVSTNTQLQQSVPAIVDANQKGDDLL
jgi:hypothetical protein